MKYIEDFVREIPDFPRKGVSYKDITPLMLDNYGMMLALNGLEAHIRSDCYDKVLGPESSGFFFGPIIANSHGKGFIPARKKGRLPGVTLQQEYTAGNGKQEVLEIQADAIRPGERILIVDDLIATGSTTKAAIDLVERAGGMVYCIDVVIELAQFNGSSAISPHRLWSVVQYYK